ncbi:MAG: hypothetical protein PVI24_04325, partial [Myxococcales bacterium]
MASKSPSVPQILWVYTLVSAGVFAVTRLQSEEGFGRYVSVVVAAIFLLSAITLTRDDPAHYGMALGGLLEPPRDDRPVGPLGLWDLARALRRAAPSALRELGVAVMIAAVVFPLYAVGYWWWKEPSHQPTLHLSSGFVSLAMAQVIVVALPEEAFFR